MSIIGRRFQTNIHGVTGVLAIFLMAFHAMCATSVLRRGNKRLLRTFHSSSLSTWILGWSLFSVV